MPSRARLEPDALRALLASVPGWELDGDRLARTFEFDTYASGVMFAAACGRIADTLDHHPDLHIGYRKVRASVNTHDAGGITEWDFELARRIDALLERP